MSGLTIRLYTAEELYNRDGTVRAAEVKRYLENALIWCNLSEDDFEIEISDDEYPKDRSDDLDSFRKWLNKKDAYENADCSHLLADGGNSRGADRVSRASATKLNVGKLPDEVKKYFEDVKENGKEKYPERGRLWRALHEIGHAIGFDSEDIPEDTTSLGHNPGLHYLHHAEYDDPDERDEGIYWTPMGANENSVNMCGNLGHDPNDRDVPRFWDMRYYKHCMGEILRAKYGSSSKQINDTIKYTDALIVGGVGSGTKYEISVSGDIIPVDGKVWYRTETSGKNSAIAKTAENVEVTEGKITGEVAASEYHGFYFSGELESVDFDHPHEARLWVNRYPHTLVIDGVEGGSEAEYDLRVTGKIEHGGFTEKLPAGDGTVDVSVDRTDQVDEQSASGVVSSGADGFLFTGEIESLDIVPSDEATVYLDGEELHTLVIDGVEGDSGARYDLKVTGDLQGYNGTLPTGDGRTNVWIDDSEKVGENSAEGVVVDGADGYLFTGEIESLSVGPPNEARIYVDGEQRPPDHPHTLVIDGVAGGTEAEYEFEVTGTLRGYNGKLPAGEQMLSVSIDDSEEVGENFAKGVVVGGADGYLFSGNISNLNVHPSNEAHVYVDGNGLPTASFEVDPSVPAPDKEVAFDAGESADPDGEIISYDWEFRQKPSDNPIPDSGETVTRSFSAGEYAVSLTVTDESGETATTSKTLHVGEYPNTLVIEGTDAPSGTSYTFSVSGDLVRVEGELAGHDVSKDPQDQREGNRAQGWVAEGADGFRYSGEITEFSLDNPDQATVYVNGSVRPPNELPGDGENQPPVAALNVTPSSPTPGEAVAITAGDSRDPDGSIVSYEWAIYRTESGTIDPDPIATPTGESIEYSFTDPVTYTIELTVTDDSGATDTTSDLINVNSPPEATFEFRPSDPDSGTEVTFNASGASDPDGSISSYEWEFIERPNQDPFETAAGVTVTKSFSPGTYAIRLTVTDDDGASASKITTLTISNQPPEAAFDTNPPEPVRNEPVTFAASRSEDPDGSIVSYDWKITQEEDSKTTVIKTGTGELLSHTFEETGDYTIRLEVTDDDNTSATTSDTITVGVEDESAIVANYTFRWTQDTPEEVDVTLQWHLPGTVDRFEATLPANTTVNSQSDFEQPNNDNTYRWIGETQRPSLTFEWEVAKEVLDSSGVESVDTGSWALLTRPDVDTNWGPDNSTDYRVTMSVDGDGVAAGEIAYLGEHEIREINVPNQTIRVVIPATAKEPDPDVIRSLRTAARVLQIGARDSIVSVFIVPETVQFPGYNGVEYQNAFWIRECEESRVPDNLWIHEYVHARQAYDPDRSMEWIDEGAADYLSALVAYHAGLVSYNEFYEFIATDQYASEILSNPNSWSSPAVEYIKGRRVVAGLDAEIRDLTEEYTFQDVYRRMNAHDGTLTYDDFRSIVVGIAGESLDSWLDDYVRSDAAPPVPDDPGRYGQVNVPPTAQFDWTPESPSPGEEVTLDATDSGDPDGTITSYEWEFRQKTDPDSETDSGEMIRRSFSAGIYTVTLTVTGDDGTTDTTSKTIEVNLPPEAQFDIAPSSPIPDEEVVFDGSDSTDPDGSIERYQWTIYRTEEGEIDSDPIAILTGQTITYSFDDPVTYLIRLTVTDDNGKTASTSEPIEVMSPPEASIRLTPSSPDPGEEITLDASESGDPGGSIVSYEWEFIEQPNQNPVGTASGETVTHSFSSGTYAVRLTVTDDHGVSATDETTLYVGNKPPTASFDANPPDPALNEAVTFDGSLSSDPDGSIITYEWTITKEKGSGTVRTATGEFLSHTFEETGRYTIHLTVTDDEGATDSASLPLPIEVDPGTPEPRIRGPESPVPAGREVTFSGEQSRDPDGRITSYTWTVSQQGTAIKQVIGEIFTYQFPDAGTYTVELEVLDTDNISATTSRSINVTAPNEPPVAKFQIVPGTHVRPDEEVTFDATPAHDPDGAITSYEWEFQQKPYGNRVEASGETVTRSFSQGEYAVTLTVTDDDGAKATTSKTLDANHPPEARFSISPSSPPVDEEVTLDASDSSDPDGSIASYEWTIYGMESGTIDPEPITTRNGQTVTYPFPEPIAYSVELTVTDDSEATDTASKVVDVTTPTDAAFIITPSSPRSGEQVTFDASESDASEGSIVSYEWDFREKATQNSETDSGLTVRRSFTSGEYAVTLTVTDNAGNTDTETKPLEVSPPPEPPVPRFDMSPASPSAGETVAFDASSSSDPDGSITSYEWAIYRMEEGEIDPEPIAAPTGETIEYSFTDPVTYNVELTVTDDSGTTATASQLVAVNAPPTAAFEMRPSPPAPGEEVTFDANASSDPDNTITSYEWEFRKKPYDNVIEDSGETVTRAFSGGTYAVTLIVTDDVGATDSISKTLEVGPNQPPNATIDASLERVYVGETISLDGSGSTDPGGDVVSYEWSIDSPSGTTTHKSGSEITYDVSSEGTHHIRLVVTDDEGATDSTGTTFEAKEQPPYESQGQA